MTSHGHGFPCENCVSYLCVSVCKRREIVSVIEREGEEREGSRNEWGRLAFGSADSAAPSGRDEQAQA